MRPFHANSTLTSKGQVTIPKIIRDLLQLQVGNDITFAYDGSQIIVQKRNEFKIPDSVISLLLLMIDKKMKIGIVGQLGSGKTYLIQKLLNAMEPSRIVALERQPELDEESLMNQHQFLSCNEQQEKADIRAALQNPLDLLFVDEAGQSPYFEELMKTRQEAMLFTDFYPSGNDATATRYIHQEVYPDVLVFMEKRIVKSIQRFTYSTTGNVHKSYFLYPNEPTNQ